MRSFLFILLVFVPLAACSGDRLPELEEAIVAGDERNAEIAFSVSGLPGQTVTLDITDISGNESSIDFFRLLLHLADRLDNMGSGESEVFLSSFGKLRYVVPASETLRLGSAFPKENPVYLMRTFPQFVLTAERQPAFPEREGGWLAVAGAQMEDFSGFIRGWVLQPYIEHSGPDAPMEYRDDEAF